ncbi:hypothetical protein VB776_23210 [Arcicella sp. DC2W]|uniref:Beta-lactamase-inhibitor-like PepSY-like domain-containing protein n=1 Tax=Arcicella gelida TaxID=2984195 RepID=A0ABU5SBJ1_9BACT|nr:hypothetical protein [Arcicella sp. DC2W]MEA5405867.1 hypothetical protein [Arcicella sp. DC2W]
MKSSITILAIFTLFISCKEESTTKINKYFDLKTSITNQINVLNKEKPTFSKTVWSDNTPETKDVKIEDWSKELELFLQTDLNKPAYLNSYEINQSDSLIVYHLKKSENLPVNNIKILLKNNQLTAMEATIANQNYLYETDKHVKMTLVDNVVNYYLIEGTQKLVFGDKKAFKIEAKVKK